VYGITGKPNTPYYKVSASYLDGYVSFGQLTYSAPDAYDKARAADEILRERLKRLGLTFDEIRSEFVGMNACHGPIATALEPNEVTLRVGVRGKNKSDIERFGKEIAPLILTGPPSATGFSGGRPKASDVVAYFPALLDKGVVEMRVEVNEN
jgi:hypothetical protein